MPSIVLCRFSRIPATLHKKAPEEDGWYAWNFVKPNSTILTRKNVNTQGNIEGGVHRGDLFVDDGSIYVMSITTEWQNAPKGDEGSWIKIRIN